MRTGLLRIISCGFVVLLGVAVVHHVAAGLPKIPKPGVPATASGGVDPKAWLNKADVLVTQVEDATTCLESSRSALFSLAATAEEKKLLAEAESETADAGQDVVLRKQQFQEDVLKKAAAEKRYEERRLTGEQVKNLGRLGGNLLLAIKRDTQALDSGKSLLDKADDVMKATKDPAVAMRLGADAGRVAGMPAKISTALQGIPTQLSALQGLLEAVEQTRRNNAVDLTPAPESGGSYETVEDF